jgi:hypothetical protein
MKLSTRKALVALLLAGAAISAALAASVTIQSGTSPGNPLVIDSTSNAGRVVPYDSRGNFAGQKATYAGSVTAKTATAAGTAPFFSICGSATKTVRVQRIYGSATIATAALYVDPVLIKTSTATSAGTPVALTKVPLDSGSAAATANLVNYYSALATAGTPVGAVASQMMFAQITGTITTGGTMNFDFDFRAGREAEAPVLRGIAQCVEASFGTTTTNAPTMTIAVIWTEE